MKPQSELEQTLLDLLGLLDLLDLLDLAPPSAALNQQLGEARPAVRLPPELQLLRLSDHDLGRGEDLQVAHHVTAHRPALAVRQADVEVSVRVQGPHQGQDLEGTAQVEQLVLIGRRGVCHPERCRGDAAHTGDDERSSKPRLLHEGLQRPQQLLTRTEADCVDLQGGSS